MMLQEKQNKTGKREGAEKQPDPISEPPPNRAPKIGGPSPHFWQQLFTTESENQWRPFVGLDQAGGSGGHQKQKWESVGAT